MKIVITGAGGFLTSRLTRHYADKFDIFPLTAKALDVTDAQATLAIIKDIQPTVIVHAAAITQTQACEDNPQLAQRVNVEGAVNVARAAKAVGAKLVFFSTEQVFNGNLEPGPYTEASKPVPNTVYGQTKLEAEGRLRQELEELYILRLSWLFGLPERQLPMGTNLFWKVVQGALSGQAVKLAANEYRGITYVYDVIDPFYQLIDLPYGTYHLGSDNSFSTYETGLYILQGLGLPPTRLKEVLIPDYDKYQDQPRDVRLAYEKIKSAGLPILTSQASIDRAIAEFGVKL